jgi:hypothetical protein
MLRGLWKLSWIEIKVFLREPMGAIGTIAIPVLLFVVLGRTTARNSRPGGQQVHLGELARVDGDPDSPERRALACDDCFNLSGRRDSQTPASHATPPADHSERARGRQVVADSGHVGLNGSGREAILSGKCSCAVVFLYDRAVGEHAEYFIDWIRDREHRPHRAVCAADWGDCFVSDDRVVRTLLSSGSTPSIAAGFGSNLSSNLCSPAVGRDLERRALVRALVGFGSVSPGICGLYSFGR